MLRVMETLFFVCGIVSRTGVMAAILLFWVGREYVFTYTRVSDIILLSGFRHIVMVSGVQYRFFGKK